MGLLIFERVAITSRGKRIEVPARPVERMKSRLFEIIFVIMPDEAKALSRGCLDSVLVLQAA